MRILILLTLIGFVLGIKPSKLRPKNGYKGDELDVELSSSGLLSSTNHQDVQSSRLTNSGISTSLAEYWDNFAKGLQLVDKLKNHVMYGLRLLRDFNQAEESFDIVDGFLIACQSSATKPEKQVQKTLRKTKSVYQRLIQAIQTDDRKQLLNSLQETQVSMPQTVASVYAGIKALVVVGPQTSKISLPFEKRYRSNRIESCEKQLRHEFVQMHDELLKLLRAVNQAITRLEGTSIGRKFDVILKSLMHVETIFDKYVDSASENNRQDFVKACEDSQISEILEDIQKALEDFKKRLQRPNVQRSKERITTVESTNGLFIQAMFLKSACNAAAQFERSTATQARQVRTDIHENHILLLEIQEDARDILASN